MKTILTVAVLLCLALPVFAHTASPFQLPQYSVLVPQPPVAVPVQVYPIVRLRYWSARRGLFGRIILRPRWRYGVAVPQQKR